MCQIGLFDPKKDMQQAACNARVGAVLGLKLFTEVGETPICGQLFDNTVGEVTVDIGILRVPFGLLGKQLIVQRKGDVIGENGTCPAVM